LSYLVFILLIFVSCQPTVTQKTQPKVSSSAIVVTALMDLPLDHTIMSDVDPTWSATLENAPSWLGVAVVGNAIKLTGTPVQASGYYTNIKLKALHQGSPFETIFNLEIRGDILRPFQWHLRNDGESFFSRDSGVAGVDMKVIEAWQLGALGVGVRIAVSDSSAEITHPDLVANMLSGEHRNYITGTLANNFIGTPNPGTERHGTAVSGIISAVGWNNLGGTGVAPSSKIASFNFVDSTFTTEMILNQASGAFDIFNYSYGTSNISDYEDDFVYVAHLRNQVTSAKEGRGRVYIKAAGNEYDYYCLTSSLCAPQNANIPLDNNIPYIILTAASDASGIAASYSNAGSNIWITAPGGEDGDRKPATVTTDLVGCVKGSSRSGRFDSFNTFEAFSSTDNVFKIYNPNCDYSSMMNGTSSSAPNTTGVVALMLSEFPSLTWREVKHILALTAVRIHANSIATNHPYESLRLTGYTYEQGWVQNAAGHYFHNWYGFGQVNAKRAVEMARQMKNSEISRLPASWSETNSSFSQKVADPALSLAIPDGSATGVTSQVSLSLGSMKVESVQINLQVTHAQSGQVGVELTSPAGTKSILLNINNALLMSSNPDSDLDVTLLSHAFYGENATGTWTLRLIDGKADALSGTLDQWAINILGH